MLIRRIKPKHGPWERVAARPHEHFSEGDDNIKAKRDYIII